MSRIGKDLHFCGRQPPLIFSNRASPHFGASIFFYKKKKKKKKKRRKKKEKEIYISLSLSLSWKKEKRKKRKKKKREVISLGLILAYKNSY
jgi:hypothetical protein